MAMQQRCCTRLIEYVGALVRAGRRRGIDQMTAEIEAELCKTQVRQPLLVDSAMDRQALALLAELDTACETTNGAA